jgi:hypothetical protein
VDVVTGDEVARVLHPYCDPRASPEREEARARHILAREEVARLPWARAWQRRCLAVREPTLLDPHHGRCELRRDHGLLVDHALARGLDTLRWSTRWTS